MKNEESTLLLLLSVVSRAMRLQWDFIHPSIFKENNSHNISLCVCVCVCVNFSLNKMRLVEFNSLLDVEQCLAQNMGKLLPSLK